LVAVFGGAGTPPAIANPPPAIPYDLYLASLFANRTAGGSDVRDGSGVVFAAFGARSPRRLFINTIVARTPRINIAATAEMPINTQLHFLPPRGAGGGKSPSGKSKAGAGNGPAASRESANAAAG